MENQNEDFCHILLIYFRKGKNVSQAHKKLCAVYGNEALNEWQSQNWMAKFRSDDFSLKDEKRTGRPVEFDDDQIKTLIDLDHHSTTFEIAEKLHYLMVNSVKGFRQINKNSKSKIVIIECIRYMIN
ncbi:histone-lysine N-methyltransferase SETMAR-like [Hydra vulgaris]|uniref:histone-lysine N-methyltransferase SETMAR-like n=1 Tax=Hydra vulgaris TaxID=6087 RepID=UPI001F5E686F|nr:histone-lysine N-methyltransferase SETMAR-like [Hydra vulgaris]